MVGRDIMFHRYIHTDHAQPPYGRPTACSAYIYIELAVARRLARARMHGRRRVARLSRAGEERVWYSDNIFTPTADGGFTRCYVNFEATLLCLALPKWV